MYEGPTDRKIGTAPAKGPNFQKLHRRYPTLHYLRERARRRLPRFAFEYGDGGAGSDLGIARNWSALNAIELVGRYCTLDTPMPPVDVELFGRRYAAPIGIAPMGSPILVWPDADRVLARAAQRARVPYTLGVVGGTSIEEMAEIAPDVLWFQLYRFSKDDHAIGFDLMRRAEVAGAHVLMMTIDASVRTTRPREVVVGVVGGGEFRPDLKMIAGILSSPGWAWALFRNGQPRFASIQPYVGANATLNDTIRFAAREMGGVMSWDELKRYRDKWKRPFVVKGILHPADAEKAVAIGADGIVVSNHGGRQVEALPATVDCLPAIVEAVGSRATVLFDSGIRSGTDVARVLALGASAAFAGKAFLWGLGALGAQGADYVIDLLVDELRSSLGQMGARDALDARNIKSRHLAALEF